MTYMFYAPVIGGYTIDLLAILRIALSIGAIYYYTMFCKHKEAKLYQCRLKRMTFVFFLVESGAELLTAALGNMDILFFIIAAGRFGVAFTVFWVSQNVVASSSSAYAPLVIPLVFTGVVQLAALPIDILSLVSIVLILLTLRNYQMYYKTQRGSGSSDSARSFFLLALLSYYTFLFIGALLDVEMESIGELAIVLAVGLGFYSARAAAKLSEI